MENTRSIDPAAAKMLEIARQQGMETAWDRYVAHATADTIAARNLLRMIAAGAASHSDHGRDVVEALHRTHMGVDHGPASLILHGLRCSLSDGWGGSMLATEFSDILFGTPHPIRGQCNLGVLRVSEKAVSIGAYVIASGIFTVLGTVPPVLGSKAVTELLTQKAKELIGGYFAVETDPFKAAELIISHIDEKRAALGI